jgi:hypothetical protein
LSFFGKRPPSGSGARDVLVTGIPRSGTTLSCHLLNKLPDVVALHEPMDVSRFFGVTDADEVRGIVERWCAETRRSVLERGVAPSKQVGGKVPDNPVGAEIGASGARRRIVTKGEVTIDRPVTADFTLVVKHPALFTVLVEALAPRFPMIAIVRNPLPVLCSWNSVELHIRDGRVPATERLVPGLAEALERLPDATARQLHLVNWYFERYARLFDRSRIVRYEDLVATRGKALAALVPAAASLDEPLASRNRSELYSPETMRRLADRLLADRSSDGGGAWRRFYAPADVEALLSSP